MRPICWIVHALASFLTFTSHTAPAGAQHNHAEHRVTQAAGGLRTPAPPDAYLYIGRPFDGEVVKAGRVKVWFGARNIGVAPAGVTVANTGHHHLLINVPLPAFDEPIPNTKNHLHFGAGQTETYLELTPGTYTLQLIMGDSEHVPHDRPLVSKKITIRVR
jgi:hypothetical protein